MIVFYIACFLGLVSLVSGLLVLLRAGNKPENRAFFAVSFLSFLWSVVFASIELPDQLDTVRMLNKLAFVFGILLMFSGTVFTYYFPKKQPIKSLYYYSVFIFIIFLLSFTDLVAGKVEQATDGTYLFFSGELSTLYVLGFISGVALILINTIRARRGASAETKSQLEFIMFGYTASLLIGITLSVIIPNIFPQTALDDLTPASLTFMVVLVSYAIIKHKLFDFRAVLARSLTYLFTTLIVLFSYVVIAFFVKRLFLPNSIFSVSQLLSNVILTSILVLTFPYIKKRFDKITNKFFFRDAYDPQAFLEKLNKTIVSDINLETLLTKSAESIETTLKTEYCSFHLRDTAYFDSRLLGDERKIDKEEFEKILALVPKVHKRAISVDSEPTSEEERELIALLKASDIEVLVRLVSTLDYDVAGVGNLLIGPKKSGSVFTEKDVQVLEIIANELVIAIENALRFEEIEQFNVTLQKKIDDATKELKRSNDKLKALDEAKDEFVSMASHQLRTPLTSIKGYISMVVEGDAGEINDTQKQMLGQALFSSQRMVYLISDLLNVSRLKTGKFVIEAKPLYLPDVVESELSQLYEGANAKNITLEFKKPESFPTIDLDEMKIRQVIMNFTDNAIYYTPSGGKITVALQEKKQTVEFTVKDSGIGVPKQEQHKLFAKFYRAENARKARPDGTGLGLFMAKKVIVAQSGSLIFESKEGKGSTFGFAFPKK